MWIKDNLEVSVTPLPKLPVNIQYGFIDTRFGRILIGLTEIQKGGKSLVAICVLYFVQKDDETSLEKVRKNWPKVDLIQDAAAIEKYSHQLFEEKENATAIDIAVVGTPLQLAVWTQLVKMKSGSTCTYSELAEMIDRPKAVRAVASAVGKNEVSILIPCHRIVSKSGAVKYGWGAELKCALLDYEAGK